MAGYDPLDDDNAEAPPAEETTPKRTRKTTTSPPSKTGDEARGPKATTTKKETPVAAENNDNGGISITLKGGPGHSAPWVVLHPKDPDQAVEWLSEENREKLKDILTKTQQAAEFFQGAAPATTGTTEKAPTRDRYGAPQGATEHPQGRTEVCDHGKMEFKSGVYRTDGKFHKAGDTWKAFDCTEGICPRVWDNKKR